MIKLFYNFLHKITGNEYVLCYKRMFSRMPYMIFKVGEDGSLEHIVEICTEEKCYYDFID